MRFDAQRAADGAPPMSDLSGLTQASLAAAGLAPTADGAPPPPAPPPPPPRQLQLKDLTVKQLRVLIKALGGEGELEEAGVMVDKSELLSVAFRVLASSPLPLIDEVTSALGLSQVRAQGLSN